MSCDDADVDTDVTGVAGVDVFRSELVPKARFWRDALGFVASEMEAIIAERLAIEDCDVVGGAERKADIVLDSEYKLLRVEDVVEAETPVSAGKLGQTEKKLT